MTCLVLCPYDFTNFRGTHRVCGVDIAEGQVNFCGGEGSVTEKVLECQYAMGVVLHEVAAETVSKTMGMEFRG